MEKKDDLRVIRTKRSIKTAFYELVEEKAFEKISVRDIAKRAMINRTTFYLHYQDKYDLLKSLEKEVLEEIDKYSDMITRETTQSCREKGLPFPHVIGLLTYVEQNSAFFKLMAHGNTGLSFYKKVGEQNSKKIFKILPELEADELLKKYAKTIAISVFSSILNQWVISGMEEPKGDLALLMSRMMLSNLQYLD